MTQTVAHQPDAIHDAAAMPLSEWRLDYSICTCECSGDSCPHCGLIGSDAHHRGRCHARQSRLIAM